MALAFSTTTCCGKSLYNLVKSTIASQRGRILRRLLVSDDRKISRSFRICSFQNTPARSASYLSAETTPAIFPFGSASKLRLPSAGKSAHSAFSNPPPTTEGGARF